MSFWKFNFKQTSAIDTLVEQEVCGVRVMGFECVDVEWEYINEACICCSLRKRLSLFLH